MKPHHVKKLYSGHYIFPPNLRGGGWFMNEMCVSTGFMNGVTSLFVPNLCLDHDNNVATANGPTHKKPPETNTNAAPHYRQSAISNLICWLLAGMFILYNNINLQKLSKPYIHVQLWKVSCKSIDSYRYNIFSEYTCMFIVFSNKSVIREL